MNYKYKVFCVFFLINCVISDEVLFLDNFNKGESDWYTEGRAYYYSNGYYVLETSTGTVGPSLYSIDIDLNRDFEIKTEIVFEKDADDYDSYGILWGAAWNDEEERVSDASYFGLSNAGAYAILTEGESEWTGSDFINIGKNSVNELKIQKINEDYKFFINGILVDTRPFKSNSFYGDYIGFQITHPENDKYKKMKVNYLEVLYLGSQDNSQYSNLNQSNFSSNQTVNIENVVLNEKFNSNNNKWWEGKQGADFDTFTGSGKYFINTNKGFQVRTGISLDLDYNNKFSIESDILLADGKSDNSYHGIFWGGSSQFPHGEGDSFNYFIIDPDHNLYRIGKQDNSSGVDLELLESGWVETTFLKSNNNIKIDRDGNEYKIYINGQLVDVVTGLDSEGEYVGFLCYESDIKIENLRVSETVNIENVVLNEKFNSNNNKWWEGKQGADFDTFTGSGKYFINTNKGFQVRTGISLDLDYNNKFSIESDILLADGKSDNSYHGIFWGGSSQFPHGEGDSFNYFIIDPDHNLYRIGKQDNSSGVDLELLESGWVETTFLKSNNNIKIDRDGNEYKIYINGQLVDVVTGLDSEGEYVGFLCYESDIKIENLRVSEIESDNSNVDYSNINKPIIEEIDMSMFFIPEGSPGSGELLRNNQYLLEGSDEGAVAFLYYDFNTSNDFDIEFKFKYNSFNDDDDDDAGIGLSWGEEEALFMAGLMNNNTFIYGNVLEDAPILKDVDLPSQIRKNSFNELLIKKRADKYEFYLNNKMIAKAPFQFFSGELLAVEMSPYQKAIIDKIVYTVYPKNKNVSCDKSFGDYYALLIGVSDYECDCDEYNEDCTGRCSGLDDLPAISSEMKLLSTVLKDEYCFKNVKVLDSPTRSEIFTWITHFEQRLSKNDNFLLFFSGHGDYSEAHRGRAYWYPSDAHPDNRASWLPDSEIKDFISALKSDHVLVMTDACMAGAFALSKSTDFPTNAKEVFEKHKRKSRTLMTAADIGELAPGKSEFVKFIIQELQLNEDFLSSEELYNNIKRPIKVNTVNPNDPDGNTPIRAVLEGDAGGDFIFVK